MTRSRAALSGLPPVLYYEVWNEGNLGVYLAPQYEGNKLGPSTGIGAC